jgi:hypothetical protein
MAIAAAVLECTEGRRCVESALEQPLDQGIGCVTGQPPGDGLVAEIDGECAVLSRLFGNMYHVSSTDAEPVLRVRRAPMMKREALCEKIKL